MNRAEDRFADVLERSLGPGWRVGNAARIGWDTMDEDRALRSYPVVPNLVVLAYFVNDIYGAAAIRHFPLKFPVRFPHFPPLKYVVDHFALANFVYWRLARMGNMEGAARLFWDRLRQAYADPGVWAEHASELDSIVSWCRERHIPLIALIIPHLADVAGTAPMPHGRQQVRVFHGQDRGRGDGDMAGRLLPVLGQRPVPGRADGIGRHRLGESRRQGVGQHSGRPSGDPPAPGLGFFRDDELQAVFRGVVEELDLHHTTGRGCCLGRTGPYVFCIADFRSAKRTSGRASRREGCPSWSAMPHWTTRFP